jgi:mRNA interferase MazF
MRALHLARLDKVRPVVVLTRDFMVPHLARVTVAPIIGTIRGLPTEVPVGARDGLDHDGVVSCDNIQTVRKSDLGRHIGYFHPDQESELTDAVRRAFDLS